MTDKPLAETTTRYEDAHPSPPDAADADAPAAPPRRLALLVSEEEADALMHVLLLAPMEGGAFGAATDRLLGRLAELQRAFGREDNF